MGSRETQNQRDGHQEIESEHYKENKGGREREDVPKERESERGGRKKRKRGEKEIRRGSERERIFGETGPEFRV